MNSLRSRLFEITENGNPSSHPGLIASLCNEFPHSIKVVDSPTDVAQYTCVMHAFNIVEDAEYIELAQRCPPDIYASSELVQYLIYHGVLVHLEKPTRGCLVVYFQNAHIKHIGRADNTDHVISKWGIGYLYEHGLFEVPSSYGTEVEYYSPIGRDTTIRSFIAFAHSKGFSLNEGSD